MPGLVQAHFGKLVHRSMTWIVHLPMAHVNTDFTRRVLFCLDNFRDNPVVVQFPKQVLRLHGFTNFRLLRGRQMIRHHPRIRPHRKTRRHRRIRQSRPMSVLHRRHH